MGSWETEARRKLFTTYPSVHLGFFFFQVSSMQSVESTEGLALMTLRLRSELRSRVGCLKKQNKKKCWMLNGLSHPSALGTGLFWGLYVITYLMFTTLGHMSLLVVLLKWGDQGSEMRWLVPGQPLEEMEQRREPRQAGCMLSATILLPLGALTC